MGRTAEEGKGGIRAIYEPLHHRPAERAGQEGTRFIYTRGTIRSSSELYGKASDASINVMGRKNRVGVTYGTSPDTGGCRSNPD